MVRCNLASNVDDDCLYVAIRAVEPYRFWGIEASEGTHGETCHGRCNRADNPVVSKAREVFGDTIAAAIATGQWPPSDGSERFLLGLDERAMQRLSAALDVARPLLRVEAPTTVRAWFAGQNPLLDDQAPAIMISRDPEMVRTAANDLLQDG